MDWHEDLNYFIRYPGKQLPPASAVDEKCVVRCNQTHSDHVRVVGLCEAGKVVEDCDALVTAEKNLYLVIKTADCVPVTIIDEMRGVVANVHAGWRGTAARIVEKTLLRMSEVFACIPSELKAIIGPCIGPCCFEVGDEVVEAIGLQFVSGRSTNDKPMLDLRGANLSQLKHFGIQEDNIAVSNECTCCSDSLPSYRRCKTIDRIETFVRNA